MNFLKILNRFVPGRAGTKEFVPGHFLLPLSQDNGTPGQEFSFCPGTTLPSETLICIHVLGEENYENGLDCSWKISATDATKCIELEFLDFDVEYQSSCR